MNIEFRILNIDKKKKSRILTSLFHIPYSIFHIPSRGGFTIIETLVAIAILLLAIVGPLTMAEKGLASAEAARQEITAFYLAQEAIEYVRNIRDTNALQNGGQWLQNLNECLKPSGCGIDVTESPQNKQTKECTLDNEYCRLYHYVGDPLNFVQTTDPLYGIFGHRTTGGWKPTEFSRRVYVTEIVPDVEASTTVRVMWNTPSFGSRYLDLTEHMLHWYTSPQG